MLLKFFIISTLCIFMFFVENAAQNESEYYAHYNTELMNARNPKYAIHPLLLSRMSIHEMSGAEISDDELFALFEAARWSPSSINIQPWNFVYAKRNTDHWKKFLDLPTLKNQRFCADAAVLIIAVANVYETYNGNKQKIEYYSHDTSAAVFSLVLEASARGFATHEMAGFNKTAAAILLDISENIDYSVQVMIAIGRRPPEAKRTYNETVTTRVPAESFVSEGVFKPRQINLQG